MVHVIDEGTIQWLYENGLCPVATFREAKGLLMAPESPLPDDIFWTFSPGELLWSLMHNGASPVGRATPESLKYYEHVAAMLIAVLQGGCDGQIQLGTDPEGTARRTP